MKSKLITIFAVICLVAGIVLLAYPIVGNMIFQRKQNELNKYYSSKVEEFSQDSINSMLEECIKYNRDIIDAKVKLTDPFDEDKLGLNDHPYVDLLNPTDNGAMGTLEIPSIDCKLIIFHGTDENTLAKGLGHLRGSSLPVGGIGTHAIISGHTGTADKRLFTDLDQVKKGDTFYIHVLNQVLAYQVDDIRVVLPEETENLYIDREKDYVTLVTCTPYGVNTHRLLVRGTRIPYEEAEKLDSSQSKRADSTWKNQYIRAIIIGIIISVVIITIIVISYKSAKRKKRKSFDTVDEIKKNK